MADRQQLPHLLKLLDDDSDGVRRAVAAALADFGPALEEELAKLDLPADAQERHLIDRLLAEFGENSTGDPTPCAFRPGQLVRHRRYDYRGVIVAFDHACQANDDWYFSNHTQPNRSQPWYHVLVDGSQQVTYAAQTSLESDPTEDPVNHPLVQLFFSTLEDGEYLRNERPWPSS